MHVGSRNADGLAATKNMGTFGKVKVVLNYKLA
jgi:hypothetical protein